jgi:sialate O-acetylesterase
MMIKKLIFLIWAFVSAASAAVRPAGIFSDDMIFQRNEPVRIWGTADPQEAVTVQFAGQEKCSVTDDSGRWMVTLDPMPASSEPRKIEFSSSLDSRPLTLSNILVGEVWLAGGQSNMARPMDTFTKTTQPDIDSANDPLLRMVTIPQEAYVGAKKGEKPVWQQTTRQTVEGFSATAYYFARDLRKTLKVPVGIIVCAVGGSPAEAWMSRGTLSSDPLMSRVLENYEKLYRLNFPTDEAYEKYVHEGFPQMLREYKQKKKKGITPNPKPSWEMGPRHFQRPCGLYEVMLTQTVPYSIRGVIWYQGENNANSGAAWHYRQVFSTLIQEWRSEFRNPDLPFLFVQLPTFGTPQDNSAGWSELRESQRLVEQDVPNTGMAVLVDGGEQKDIHPHSKDKAGHRLALLAREMVYGEKDLVCRGPRLLGKKQTDGKLMLTFSDTGSGLVLKPEAGSAFEVCGSDGNFVPAQAELKGNDAVMVSSAEVSDPQDVRYGWRKWFVPTLYNQDGLPASPFRTDDQPMQSEGNVYLDAKIALMKK